MQGSVRAGDGCVALPGRSIERDDFPIYPEKDREQVEFTKSESRDEVREHRDCVLDGLLIRDPPRWRITLPA